jgi:hypothetical protein
MDEGTKLKLAEIIRTTADNIRREQCKGWRGGFGPGPIYYLETRPEALATSSTTLADGSERMDIIGVTLPGPRSIAIEPTIKVQTFFGNHDEFWAPRVEIYEKAKDGHGLAIIGGQWLTVGGVRYPARGGGFAGRHFRIRFNDGTVVDTCDLWSSGIVPPFWRETIKDNAEFLDIEGGDR